MNVDFDHGGPQGPDEVLLDFSVNTNPLGPNPALLRAWREAPLVSYPDPHYTKARRALAAWHDWDVEGVVLGVGASELLHRLARALIRPGDVVLSLGAPFGEFAKGVALQGGRLLVLPRDAEGVLAALDHPTARVLYSPTHTTPRGTISISTRCVRFAVWSSQMKRTCHSSRIRLSCSLGKVLCVCTLPARRMACWVCA